MDKVRFGRALGYGTRHAAKTIAAAVDAASTPNPRSARTKETDQVPPARRKTGTVNAKTAGAGMLHLGRSLWKPIALFSGVLWLRVTGLFFALIAWAMGTGAWRLRGVARTRAGSPAAHHFWMFASFCVLFGYFAVSSFVRATLRERRHAREASR